MADWERRRSDLQPNSTSTLLVLLLYVASSVAGVRSNDGRIKPPPPPAVHTTQPINNAPPSAPDKPALGAAATTGQANVRLGPGKAYQVTSMLPRGAKVNLVSEANGWYQAELPKGGYGWIHGSLLSLPQRASSTGGYHVVGYYTQYFPGDNGSLNSLTAHHSSLTAIAPFSYSVDGTGHMKGDHFKAAARVANEAGLKNLALVHNISKDGGFSQEEVSKLLRSKAARDRAISNILGTLDARKYDGVNIDFENVHPSDRQYLNIFIRDLKAALGPRGYLVTMSVPAKFRDNPQAAWVGAFDYKELGRHLDQMMIMTYDEHLSGTRPGPVASLPWVEKVVAYAKSLVPANKILLGIAGYGYDWNTSTNKARAVTFTKAMETALHNGAKIMWSDQYQTPYYRYRSGGVWREVWFENAESLRAKLAVVTREGLGGIAMWRLGQEDKAFWPIIQAKLLN